ncbi:MAG TPA: BtpA/SgcQ family protein [Longimicrobiales bacterium]|nr:BtpA/SgcQ family protein [Longimicrobiales bacterium]
MGIPVEFASGKPLIGMVHLLPLPGSPRWSGRMDQVIERALRDAAALIGAGFDGLLLENLGDTPFWPAQVEPETIAAMSVVADRLRNHSELPLGINVLRNDARAAIAIAGATGAAFIRVNVHTGAMLTDQGWIEGRAAETLRTRARLDATVAICADVLVKHAIAPPGADLVQVAVDTVERGLADVLIITGAATGAPTDPDRATRIKQALPHVPVWIGSGVTAETVRQLLAVADGAIVGSSIKIDGHTGNPVDAARAADLVKAARALR